LGKNANWEQPLAPQNLALDLVFPSGTGIPCKGLIVSRLQVQVKGSNPGNYEYDVSGNLHLTVPGSVTPMEVPFTGRESNDTLELSATQTGNWQHALGINNLTASTFFKKLTCLATELHFSCQA
jgi:hypothetical protein